MIKHLSVTALLLSAAVVSAEQTRQMEAHEHGVGQLNIAIEGTRIAIELEAPGADIVGFEYKAKSSEDRAKVDAAIAVLAQPLDLFVLPQAAGCGVVEASAALEAEEVEGHDHDHSGHADKSAHTEFEAEYMLECADPAQATSITFAYFDQFPNALKLEVQVISATGAQGFEVVREAPTLDMREMF